MKTLTSIIVAAALIAPSMATAQRHATPRTAERHEMAQNKEDAKADLAREESRTEQLVDNNSDRQPTNHVNAAKAGKVNTAKALRDGAI